MSAEYWEVIGIKIGESAARTYTSFIDTSLGTSKTETLNTKAEVADLLFAESPGCLG